MEFVVVPENLRLKIESQDSFLGDVLPLSDSDSDILATVKRLIFGFFTTIAQHWLCLKDN